MRRPITGARTGLCPGASCATLHSWYGSARGPAALAAAPGATLSLTPAGALTPSATPLHRPHRRRGFCPEWRRCRRRQAGGGASRAPGQGTRRHHRAGLLPPQLTVHHRPGALLPRAGWPRSACGPLPLLWVAAGVSTQRGGPTGALPPGGSGTHALFYAWQAGARRAHCPPQRPQFCFTSAASLPPSVPHGHWSLRCPTAPHVGQKTPMTTDPFLPGTSTVPFDCRTMASTRLPLAAWPAPRPPSPPRPPPPRSSFLWTDRPWRIDQRRALSAAGPTPSRGSPVPSIQSLDSS